MNQPSQATAESWRVGQYCDNAGYQILSGPEGTFNLVAIVTGPRPLVEEKADLIAAAPELLAALEELVARCDGAEGVRADGSNIQTMRAHAVIAKAKGD